MKTKDETSELSGAVIHAALEVHREFGSRLLGRAEEAALQKKLLLRGMSSCRQVQTEVCYKGETLDGDAYRIDLLVEECVLVENRSVASIMPIHEAQLHTYMRLSQKRLDLLIHFNVILLRDGIERHVINFPQ